IIEQVVASEADRDTINRNHCIEKFVLNKAAKIVNL
ncbi:MAG: hypothetical protein K0S12_2081, partial [Bacteroidetes bacterium]|nr:hypothetical protein [Bacteroidota bacterium]